MKFRKKPVVIDAYQWTGTTLSDRNEFCEACNLPYFKIGSLKGMAGLIIDTLEGDHVAQKGDWIIQGVNGEYYPCKPDIFEKTYERAE